VQDRGFGCAHQGVQGRATDLQLTTARASYEHGASARNTKAAPGDLGAWLPAVETAMPAPAGPWTEAIMSSESDQRMSDANREALSSLLAAHVEHSATLARAHLTLTRADASWESLSVNEQAEAILAAHPWFVAARAAFMGGCPSCGVVDSTEISADQRLCRHCGRRWTPDAPADAPLIANPQAYPLHCHDRNSDRIYLVVGWTSSGTPIGVPYNLAAAANGKTYRAHELTFDMYFSIPETNVVIEGEVSSSVRGDINIEGSGPDGALGIFDAGA
jgi:hypothetical protein